MNFHSFPVPLLILLILLPSFSGVLKADTVYLKNGTTLQGDITNQDRTSIELKTLKGNRKILKTTVNRVRFGSPTLAELLKAEEERKEEARRRAEEVRRKQEEQRKAAEEEARIRAEEARRQAKAQEEKRAAEEARHEEEARAALARQQQNRHWDESLLWRSALLPGWGQWHGNRKGDAYLYGGLTYGFFLTGLSYSREAQRLHDEYNEKSLLYAISYMDNPGVVVSLALGNITTDNLLPALVQNVLKEDAVNTRNDYKQAVSLQNASYALAAGFYFYQIWNAYHTGARDPEPVTRRESGHSIETFYVLAWPKVTGATRNTRSDLGAEFRVILPVF